MGVEAHMSALEEFEEEFDEFENENWGEDQEDKEDVAMWEDDWDTNEPDDEFTQKLKQELSKGAAPVVSGAPAKGKAAGTAQAHAQASYHDVLRSSVTTIARQQVVRRALRWLRPTRMPKRACDACQGHSIHQPGLQK